MTISKEIKRVGRPRSEDTDKKVLATMADLMATMPVRKISIELLARESGISKPAIYRRWGNKCAVAMDTFMLQIEPEVGFAENMPLHQAIPDHIQAIADLVKGPTGQHMAEIIGEGQSDSDLLEEFRNRFFNRLHAPAQHALQTAIQEENLTTVKDPDLIIDMIYGPIYQRLLVGHKPIDADFIKQLKALASLLLA